MQITLISLLLATVVARAQTPNFKEQLIDAEVGMVGDPLGEIVALVPDRGTDGELVAGGKRQPVTHAA